MSENQEMANLADGQGGNDLNSSTQDQENIFVKLARMGNKTITSPPNADISELAKSLQAINETMAVMKQDIVSLKRKQHCVEKTPSVLPGKRARKEGESESADENRQSTDPLCISDSEEEEAIDTFLAGSQEEAPDGDTGEQNWLDISEYFEDNLETGEEILPELAGLANSVLRGKPKEEKVMLLKTRHKRPSNVENLQVPKVDEKLWRQLRHETKAYDYVMQKSQLQLCHALVPVLKLMQNLKQAGPVTEARELAADTFKILAQGIAQSNASRRERIRKDLLPSYKALCDKTPSATKLFGDKLQEDIKNLKE